MIIVVINPLHGLHFWSAVRVFKCCMRGNASVQFTKNAAKESGNCYRRECFWRQLDTGLRFKLVLKEILFTLLGLEIAVSAPKLLAIAQRWQNLCEGIHRQRIERQFRQVDGEPANYR